MKMENPRSMGLASSRYLMSFSGAHSRLHALQALIAIQALTQA
jgi:hypothetical protein